MQLGIEPFEAKWCAYFFVIVDLFLVEKESEGSRKRVREHTARKSGRLKEAKRPD